jgi:hypothetical protein
MPVGAEEPTEGWQREAAHISRISLDALDEGP